MNLRPISRILLGCSLGLSLLAGCSQATSTSTVTNLPLVTATVSGYVKNYNTSAAIQGATVYIGTSSTTTDSKGAYSLGGLVSGDYVVRVVYADSSKVAYSSDNDEDFSVMTLADFKTAATAISSSSTSSTSSSSSSSSSTGSVISVTSDFNATTYTYSIALKDIQLAANTATLSGTAMEELNGATAGNATALPSGTQIVLQYNSFAGSSSTSTSWQGIAYTTISDSSGSFAFANVPAWDYIFASSGSARIVWIPTTGQSADETSNLVIGSTATVNLYAQPSATTSIGKTVYFAVTTLDQLALASSDIADSKGAEVDDFAVASSITLTFNNALTAYTASATSLTRASDGSSVDATCSCSGDVLTIKPSASLSAGTRYAVAYKVTDGNTSASGTLDFETSGSAATAVSDLAIDTTAKAAANGGVSGYNAGDPYVYVTFTRNTSYSYDAQYKLSTDASWTDAASFSIYATNGTTAYAAIGVSYSTWVSGTTLDVRVVSVNKVKSLAKSKAIGDTIGGAQYSNAVTVSDTVAPTGGTISGYTSVAFASAVSIIPNVDYYPTASSAGLIDFSLTLAAVDGGSEVMSLPTISGESSTIFGTPAIALTSSGTSALVRLPVIANKAFSQQIFSLTVKDGAGNSYGSISVTLLALPAPASTSAAIGDTTNPGSVTISWPAVTSPAATSYNVYYSTTLAMTSVIKASATTNSATITGLTPGTTYYYDVTAVNAGGESLASAEDIFTLRPAAPSLTATPNSVAASGEVDLTFASAGAVGYYVYRATNPSAGYWPRVYSGTNPLYADTGTSGQTYYYYVVAYDYAYGTTTPQISAESSQQSAVAP